jgi:hypothetical protein
MQRNSTIGSMVRSKVFALSPFQDPCCEAPEMPVGGAHFHGTVRISIRIGLAIGQAMADCDDYQILGK